MQEILARESLLELAVERSLLCGMQLDRVGASIASFDLLYLPELRRRGRVAPSVDRDRVEGRVSGGAVMDSHPGLFRNVAVFDFKSLYPSLMRTFNLDPLAHAVAGEDAIVAPNGARFSRDDRDPARACSSASRARREQAKRRGDRHADLAIKIMMNALIGVLGAPSCRFFDPDDRERHHRLRPADARAHAARVREAAARACCTATPTRCSCRSTRQASRRARLRAIAERPARARAGRAVARRSAASGSVEPKLELELEHVYERFFQPSVRGGTQGSRKRYAGLVNGNLHVVGLEAVRRDWPEVSRRLQRGMLERLFRDEPVADVRARGGRGPARGPARPRARDPQGRCARARSSATPRRRPPHVEAARRSTLPVGPHRALRDDARAGPSRSSPTASYRPTSTARTTSRRS